MNPVIAVDDVQYAVPALVENDSTASPDEEGREEGNIGGGGQSIAEVPNNDPTEPAVPSVPPRRSKRQVY